MVVVTFRERGSWNMLMMWRIRWIFETERKRKLFALKGDAFS
jgi:hypothetical protein